MNVGEMCSQRKIARNTSTHEPFFFSFFFFPSENKNKAKEQMNHAHTIHTSKNKESFLNDFLWNARDLLL